MGDGADGGMHRFVAPAALGGVSTSLPEAVERHGLGARMLSVDPACTWLDPSLRVLVVEGDLVVDGHLGMDWDRWDEVRGLVVTGDLAVHGAIVNADMDSGPFLFVGGRTRARAIVAGGAELVFQGDARVDDLVLGHYNDGVLVFGGQLEAPAVASLDHQIEIRGGLSGRRFELMFGQDAWSSVVDLAPEALAQLDENAWRALDQVLIPRLLAGHALVRADLRPSAG